MSQMRAGTNRVATQKVDARVASTLTAATSLIDRWAGFEDAQILPGFAPREGHLLTATRAISARINQNQTDCHSISRVPAAS